MTLTRIGGIAALVCGGTYIFGFALLVTVFAPLGFGSSDIDPSAVAAFVAERPGLLIVWNSTIYIVNALALVVLVVALAEWQAPSKPGWAATARGLGQVWAALVLGAGMIANVGVEQVTRLYPGDPEGAADLWAILNAVELGLGGGNEIAGGAWIGCVSVAGLLGRTLPRLTAGLGILTGLGGLVTIVPVTGDVAGAAFGLGAIAGFLALGAALVLRPSAAD